MHNVHEHGAVEDLPQYLAEVPHQRNGPEPYSASITSLAQE